MISQFVSTSKFFGTLGLCLALGSACEQKTPVAAPDAAPTTVAALPAPGPACNGGACCQGGTCGGKDDPTAVAEPATAATGAALALAGETYGAGVTLGEAVPIAKLLADPDAWVGKRVRVEGEVTDVCQMRGCWFEMKSDLGQKMRFKVADGVMTFPVSARGHYAVAEGTVRKIPLDLAQTRRAMAHEAEETGRTFDPATVTQPMTIVRLDGVGAVLRAAK